MFKVPLDYQCAIVVHAVTHSGESLPAMLGRLQELQEPSLSTWETVKNTGFLRKTVAENYGRRSQIAKNLGKSAILAC